MITLDLDASTGPCAIQVNQSVHKLKEFLEGRKSVVVITDSNIRRLYRGLLTGYEIIEIAPGEEAKTLRTVENIYGRFLKLGLDRSSFVVGIGGGVVTDIAGFSASTFMRGLPFGFVPTTLLAQVDAAIGGKNGVNLERYKNIVGVFRQPRFILIDFNFLKTLPRAELLSGAAEIVKHALISSRALFEELENERARLLSLKRDSLERIVVRSIRIKNRIVRVDEREDGERRKLNFGHTLGHAVERACGIRHGEAVSVGMVMAAGLSVARGTLAGKDLERIKTLLKNIGLPVRIPLRAGDILGALKKDKKRCQDRIHFVFLSGIGRAEIQKIEFRELEEHVHDLCQYR